MAGPDPGERTVVIGLGSPLMGDDGLGLVALERLRDLAPAGVELVDGGTWGMTLLPTVETADRLLLLDAINADRVPGTLIELEGEAVPRHFDLKFSTHDIDLRDVLALAELRGRTPGRLVALGLQPDRIEMVTALSPLIERALDDVIDRAVAILADWGHPVGAVEARSCTR
jgi:hydrogenase maturation protease